MFVSKQQAFNAQSIPAAGTATFGFSGGVRRCRFVGTSAGANVSVKVQTTADGGTTWSDLATYAAGSVVGAQAVLELCDVELRLLASNAGAAAESITGWIILGEV